jgi:hypothetical protein
MKKNVMCLTGILCVLTLSGCVDRKQADDKLAKACAAGVKAILPEGTTLGKVVSNEFQPATEIPSARLVKMKAVEMDGWLEVEKDYQCVFEESFSFMNTGHTASIYQIRTPDQIIGKSGAEIVGDAQVFLKLTDAVREALYE